MIHNTYQSEFGQLKSVIIKPVLNAFVSDETLDNEWKKLNYLRRPNLSKAEEEYLEFEKILQDYSIETYPLPVHDQVGLDSLYCRDTSIPTDHGVILCEMGKPARLAEPAAIQSFFDALGLPFLAKIEGGGTLEAGDVAWLNNQTLIVGHSYRTNLRGIAQLTEILSGFQIEVIKVDLPHYRGKEDVFHLMSIFSPVARDIAVVYSPLMSISLRTNLLDRGFHLVEVPEQEFESLGCNVLALAPKRCLMLAGNPFTQQRLEEAGCEVITFAGQEICLPGGGGPTCLTRPLTRMLVE